MEKRPGFGAFFYAWECDFISLWCAFYGWRGLLHPAAPFDSAQGTAGWSKLLVEQTSLMAFPVGFDSALRLRSGQAQPTGRAIKL
jgi:hypothetical protein